MAPWLCLLRTLLGNADKALVCAGGVVKGGSCCDGLRELEGVGGLLLITVGLNVTVRWSFVGVPSLFARSGVASEEAIVPRWWQARRELCCLESLALCYCIVGER